ncbi:MAG: tRNA lysidine(34) synthetase TilS [Desulfobacterales bacterium]
MTKRCGNTAVETVKQTIVEHRMVTEGDRVLVGVSGGADSVALLDILMSLKAAFSIELSVAHFNHGLRRPDADVDEAFVASLAGNLKLSFYVEKGDVLACKKKYGLSVEQAARRLRYDFFSRIRRAQGFHSVAVGHHSDDNAEMVLMALIRGSGPLGLAGIPPVRHDSIIRPLIRLSRKDIRKYLKAKNLDCVEDATNRDYTYLRNRVRHQLMPLLAKTYNPRIADTLNRLSTILRQEEDWLQNHLILELDAVTERYEKGKIVLSIRRLGKKHPAVQRRLIRMSIAKIKGNLKKITLFHIDAVIGLLKNSNGIRRLDLPDRVLVLQKRDMLRISIEDRALRTIAFGRDAGSGPSFSYKLEKPKRIYIAEINVVLTFKETRIEEIVKRSSAGQHIAFFDMDKIKLPLLIRNLQPEDRFVPYGLTVAVNVKRFLKNRGVPRENQKNIPIMLDENGVIWVVGYRIGESVKITESTTKVLVSTMNRL